MEFALTTSPLKIKSSSSSPFQEPNSVGASLAAALDTARILKYPLSQEDKMIVYRRLYYALNSSTRKEQHRRKYFVQCLETYGVGEFLYPKTPPHSRAPLLEGALNAMILDNYFRYLGLKPMANANLSRGFDCLVNRELVLRDALFIWESSQVVVQTWIRACIETEVPQTSTLIEEMAKKVKVEFSLCPTHTTHAIAGNKRTFEEAQKPVPSALSVDSQVSSLASKTNPEMLLESRTLEDFYVHTAKIHKHMLGLDRHWDDIKVAQYMLAEHPHKKKKLITRPMSPSKSSVNGPSRPTSPSCNGTTSFTQKHRPLRTRSDEGPRLVPYEADLLLGTVQRAASPGPVLHSDLVKMAQSKPI